MKFTFFYFYFVFRVRCLVLLLFVGIWEDFIVFLGRNCFICKVRMMNMYFGCLVSFFVYWISRVLGWWVGLGFGGLGLLREYE